MTGERVEQRAESMLAAYQRIAAKMYTLDAHAGRRFLRGGRLAGATARTAQAVETDAARLWSRFNELRRLADKIPAHPDELGRKALAELEELLSRPCVEVDAAGVPGFASGEPGAEVLPLADFAAAIETDCARLLDQCATVDAACGVVADAAAALTAGLAEAERLAETLGMSGNADLAQLRTDRARALDEALADPLAAPGFAELSARVDAFGRRLSELDALEHELPQRLESLRERLTGLAETETRTAETCRLAAQKILAPAPPRFDAAVPRLRQRLDGLARRSSASDRHGLAAELAAVTAEVDRAERDSGRAADAAEALLDRRTELRGRLAAYTRKAARVGVIEDSSVAAAARAAREVLALAPCDLRSATRAVRQFQQEISGAQEAPA